MTYPQIIEALIAKGYFIGSAALQNQVYTQAVAMTAKHRRGVNQHLAAVAEVQAWYVRAIEAYLEKPARPLAAAEVLADGRIALAWAVADVLRKKTSPD